MNATATPPTKNALTLRLAALTFTLAALILLGLSTAVIGITVIVVLVICHEWGHFLVARWCGVDVEEFFVGFGPVVLEKKTKSGLRVGLKALPLGGYVRIVGMHELDDNADSPRSYHQAHWIKKVAIAIAGPAANIFVSFLLIFAMTLYSGRDVGSTYVASVESSLGAAHAHLQPGDHIVAVNAIPITSIEQARELWKHSKVARLTIVRHAHTIVVPVSVTHTATGPVIGVFLAPHRVPVSALQALSLSASSVSSLTSTAVSGLGSIGTGVQNLFASFSHSNNSSANQHRVTGPIGLIEVGNAASRSGLVYVIGLIAAYSVFLGVFNLIPILPLDGGRVAVALIEAAASKALRRRFSVPATWQNTVSAIALVIFVTLGVVAMVADVVHPITN